jgi:hypothetical protein
MQMVNPADEQVSKWMDAARQATDDPATTRRVLTVVGFLQNTGRLAEPEILHHLSLIDFEMHVTVVRLPDSLYVCRDDDPHGRWYVDTGLQPGSIGGHPAVRAVRLFAPMGVIPALKVSSLAPFEFAGLERLMQATPSDRRGERVLKRGVGDHFIICDSLRMKPS